MADRDTITQVVQIGVESTAGGTVAANRKLQALTIQPAIQVTASRYRSTGTKYPSAVVQGKEWVQAALAGHAAYNDLLYAFASMFGTVAATQQGTLVAYKYSWTPNQSSPDTPQTFTVEQGSSVRAHSFGYGLVTDLTLNSDRENVTVDGTMIGQRLNDGVTLTGAPTAIADKPVRPSKIDVYLDTTSWGLGSTQLTRAFTYRWGLTGKFGPIWPLDSSKTSFAAHAELEPTCEIVMRAEADATGMGLLTNLRAGTKNWIRFKAAGDAIGTSAYSLTIDACVEVAAIGDFSDTDGVFATEFTLVPVYDETWAKAFTIDLICDRSGL